MANDWRIMPLCRNVYSRGRTTFFLFLKIKPVLETREQMMVAFSFGLALLLGLLAMICLYASATREDTGYCDASLCSNGRTHIACTIQMLSWNNENCKQVIKEMSGVSEEHQKLIINLHNELRRNVANGLETRGSNGPQPPAANMMRLAWNVELAELAQTLAQQCLYGHDDCRNIATMTVGQNIGYLSGEEFSSTNWTEIITSWYNQVTFFNHEHIRVYKPSSRDKFTGYYSQLLWAETHEIGCGVTTFKSGESTVQFYVCNYGPSGNTKGRRVYEAGEPASNCPEEAIPCNGLCVEVKKKIAAPSMGRTIPSSYYSRSASLGSSCTSIETKNKIKVKAIRTLLSLLPASRYSL